MKYMYITRTILAILAVGLVVFVFGYFTNSSFAATTLSASCSADASSVGLNQNVTFTLSVSGGTGVYTYSWGGACIGSATSCSVIFTTPGTKTATASVTSGTSSASASCSVDVITCSTNSQCGTDAYTGSPFCQSGNVYQNYITYTCNNPDTVSSSCTNETAPQLKTTCTSGQTCESGVCVNLPVTTDLKVNSSDGPVTVSYANRNAVNFSWTSTHASSCTATSTDNVWSGSKSISGVQTISLPTVKTYTFTLACTNSTSGSSVSDSVQVTLQAPSAPTVVTKGVVVTY